MLWGYLASSCGIQ